MQPPGSVRRAGQTRCRQDRGRSRRSVRSAYQAFVDRKSTRLNSSHSQISYAVFCLKKKKLQECVKSGVTGDEVLVGPPRQLDGKHGVSLYLLALAEPQAAWVHRHSTTRVALRHFAP